MDKKVWNISSNFILPLTGYPFYVFEPYLYNAYLKDTQVDLPYFPLIFVLLKFKGTTGYTNLETTLKKDPNLKSSYDLLGGQYTMFVFQLSSWVEKDLNYIKNGQYSLVSESAKNLILKGRATKVYGEKTVPSVLSKVLSKSEQLKQYWEEKIGQSINDQEVWPIMNMVDEVFTIATLNCLPKKAEIKPEEGH